MSMVNATVHDDERNHKAINKEMPMERRWRILIGAWIAVGVGSVGGIVANEFVLARCRCVMTIAGLNTKAVSPVLAGVASGAFLMIISVLQAAQAVSRRK